MHIPSVDLDVLCSKLIAREFNMLAEDESMYLILSIIDESMGTSCLSGLKVDCQSVFAIDKNTVDAGEAIQSFIKDHFEPPARKKLAIAATTLCISAYSDAMEGGLDDTSMLHHLLELSWQFNVLIDSDVGFVIALDRVMPAEIRQLGAQHLVGGQFRSQGSPATWKRLEDEVSHCPQLVIPIMEHYIDDELEPVPALRAMTRIDLPRGRLHLGTDFELTVVEAFQLCRTLDVVGGCNAEVLAVCKTFAPSLVAWIHEILDKTDNSDLDVYLTKFPCAVI